MLDSTYLMHLQQLFQEIHGLNIKYFENYQSDLSEFDHDIRNQTTHADVLYRNLREQIGSIPFGSVCTLNDSFLLSYAIFLTHPEKESFYVIGPFRSRLLTAGDYEVIQKENHLSLSEFELVKEQIEHIPMDIQRHIPILTCKSLLKMLHPTLDIGIQDISIELPSSVPKDDIDAHTHHVETSYYHEAMLMHYVSEGNHEKALKEARYFFHVAQTQGYGESTMKHRGLLFTSNTLFRKAAQGIGIHPLYLDEISTRFAKQLSSCKTHEELDDTYLNMVNDYCTLCRDYDKQKYSEPVQKIINYILSNIATDLSPTEIAHFVNFSPSYVSKKFKEEVGMTLGNYVTEQRIRIAKKLLQNHNMQVQDVAAYVGIPDWNYFTKLFKKYTGTTPRNYRKSLL